MRYRFATAADCPLLARMNLQLIRDERHRNQMSQAELRTRMEGWLAGPYQAVIFHQRIPLGYALFRRDDADVHLRQFFVRSERRRQGLGRAAIEWLLEHPWHGAGAIRVEVLVHNRPAIEFWRAVGFADYCLTLERLS